MNDEDQVVYDPETVIIPDDKVPEYRKETTLRTRGQILEFLADHQTYYGNSRYRRIAWNIKVHHALDPFFDKKPSKNYQFKPKWDQKWREYVEEQDSREYSLFNRATESLLRMYYEGDYSTYPGDDQGDYKFGIDGRSGGWLTLDEIQLSIGRVKFDQRHMDFDIKDWINDLNNEDLAKLYHLVADVDHDVENRYDSIIEEYAYFRSEKEDEWDDEELAQMLASPDEAMASGV